MPAGISLALGVTAAEAILVVSLSLAFAFSPEWFRTKSILCLLCVGLCVQVSAAYYINRRARRGDPHMRESAPPFKIDRTSRPQLGVEDPRDSTEETVY